MSILKIKDLVHKYVTYGDTEEDKQEIAAIDHIDINVEKGEFVAILGKNGSGKSSLAKHINGLLMPTEGTVYIKGMDTKDESTLLKVRQSAGIVFQNPDIFGSYSEVFWTEGCVFFYRCSYNLVIWILKYDSCTLSDF